MTVADFASFVHGDHFTENKFSFSFVFEEINRQLFAVVEKRKMTILLKDFLRKMATEVI